MAFERIRTIKGWRYRYSERRWREGGKVRSESICLGPLDGYEQPGSRAAERFIEKVEAEQRALYGETVAERQDRERSEQLAGKGLPDGLRMPDANTTPIDRTD